MSESHGMKSKEPIDTHLYLNQRCLCGIIGEKVPVLSSWKSLVTAWESEGQESLCLMRQSPASPVDSSEPEHSSRGKLASLSHTTCLPDKNLSSTSPLHFVSCFGVQQFTAAETLEQLPRFAEDSPHWMCLSPLLGNRALQLLSILHPLVSI